MNQNVEATVRRLLAQALDLPPSEVSALPGDTPLFGGALGLGSLSGARLLARLKSELGVDVAAEDWALESLSSIDTLTEFLRVRSR